MSSNDNKYHTKIWSETAEQNNPFSAKTSYCSGYDVYGDLLGKASWQEYLYLLFKQERPTGKQNRLLHELAIILAHPGLRDHSVLAAMNGGAGGSTAASCLIAALGIGAGQLNGAHDVFLAMQMWQRCGTDINLWHTDILNPPILDTADIWDPIEHIAGFNPNTDVTGTTISQSLEHLSAISETGLLAWLNHNRLELERATQCGLSFSAIAAATFCELELSPEQGEMLYLILRLPGAGAQALEQMQYGWRKFPFYHNGLLLTDYTAEKSDIKQTRKQEECVDE